MTKVLEVVAAAILDDGVTLACRRAPGRAAAGRWEFPGGKVEANEDPRLALMRELREELDIDVVVGDLIDRTETRVGELMIDLATYYASLRGPRPNHSTDHDRLEWLAIEDLRDLEWAAPDRPAVAALVSRFRGSSSTVGRE